MASIFASAPTADDITLFTQELSWMIGAGVPLGRAIDLLAAEAGQSRLQPVLVAVRGELRAGASLADALARQVGIFPEAYLRLVALAEGTGTLPLVLQRLHAGRARAQALKRKLGSALVYPGFLMLVALGAMALIALAVVPQMRAVLPAEPRADGADGAIRRLIGMSDWLTAHAVVAAGGVALGLGALVLALRQPPVQRVLTALAARLPVLGPLIRNARLAEMTAALAMLTEAGLPLAEALRLTRRSMGTGELSTMLEAMENALRAGQDVTQPLRDARSMPPLLSSLIRVGQETGNMARSLTQAAQVFEEKTRIALDRALVLLEPAIILLISVGVGGLIYTVIGALMSVNDLFV
jgi:general secretion pathway protein F